MSTTRLPEPDAKRTEERREEPRARSAIGGTRDPKGP
ncbi:MAG: hypothetical protein H6Q90_4148, partial [Deltaproteobacteria bacterium]|nr:hypothetical protein [Deltaproteobacteria bacterium]